MKESAGEGATESQLLNPSSSTNSVRGSFQQNKYFRALMVTIQILSFAKNKYFEEEVSIIVVIFKTLSTSPYDRSFHSLHFEEKSSRFCQMQSSAT